MGIDDIFTFGKHKGEQLEDVIEDDPEYVEWLCQEEIVNFDDEAYELISKKNSTRKFLVGKL